MSGTVLIVRTPKSVLRLDTRSFRLWIDDRRVVLPKRQAILLEELMRNAGVVVPCERLWQIGWGGEARSNTLQVHMTFIRRNLAEAAQSLETVKTVGYMIYGVLQDD